MRPVKVTERGNRDVAVIEDRERILLVYQSKQGQYLFYKNEDKDVSPEVLYMAREMLNPRAA